LPTNAAGASPTGDASFAQNSDFSALSSGGQEFSLKDQLRNQLKSRSLESCHKTSNHLVNRTLKLQSGFPRHVSMRILKTQVHTMFIL